MCNFWNASFLLAVMYLSAPSHTALAQTVEILVPKKMPITITYQRDYSEPQILKYVFHRNAKGALRARITTVMLDETGTVRFKRSREGDHLSEPMSIATADTSIARILLIVEWLETDKGKWVLDTKSDSLDIPSLVKHGAKALPKAIFVAK